VPVTVFRCTHIIGPPSSPGPTAASLLATGNNFVTVLGNGKQRVAPVYLGDVVAAIEAAISSGQAGTFDLQGPEEMSLDDLVRRLNGPAKVSIAHVPAVVARLLPFVGPKLPGPLIDVMLKDCRSEHPTAHFALDADPGESAISLTPPSRLDGNLQHVALDGRGTVRGSFRRCRDLHQRG
jgi:nucleoside-diphosphate-sugar epimerase